MTTSSDTLPTSQPRVSFIHMKEGSKEDFEIIAENDRRTARDLPQRIMDHLRLMADDDGAYYVNRLEHSLQTASRAERSGADDEWVVAALIHDIGDVLAPFTHAQVAYEVIRPFVREEVAWTVKHHGIFQMQYNPALTDDQRNLHDQYRDHPYYQSALHFVEKWDQCSFDPDYPWFELEHFKPVITKVFTTERNS